MADGEQDPNDQPTSDEVPDELGAPSVFTALGSSGDGGEGVVLRHLDGEPPLELRAGTGKYQVLEAVGEGGMGKVYAAVDRDLKRPVALKMMRADGDRRMEQRFLEEAQVMGQLQHPNILHIYELGLTDRRPFYTMPLVRGRTLRTVLDELRSGGKEAQKTWSLTRLVQLLQQVAQAVDYAHARGVIHRDLKPANVMVGAHGEVQVLDWGLAKVVREREARTHPVMDRPGAEPRPEPFPSEVKTDLAQSLTGIGRMVGTPAYMSPEQAKGEEVDGRSDVYAVGVMLYEALTLTVPFRGTTMELFLALAYDAPMAPRAKAPERNIPLDLEAICLKALHKRREERQQKLGELVSELQRWLEAESDKEKRHERAEEKAAEGREKLADYLRLKGEVKRLDVEAAEVAKRFEPWQPIEEKAELFAATRRAAAARKRLTRAASETVTTLAGALSFEADNEGAREALADYYWDRFQEAESRQDEEAFQFFGDLVSAYHGGKYARELAGDGTLALTTDPEGAEVWLSPQVERGPVLVDGEPRRLGTTPLVATPLALGSYVVVLRKEGYRDTRYPVHITRNREWAGAVRLATEEEIGRGFVYVPAGPCLLGGDEEAFNAWPRKEVAVEDFFIAQHPVTMGEYLEYVNDVVRREGLDAARLRSQRRVAAVAASSYLLEDGAGGLKLPEVDAEGDRWHARWAAFGIPWHDAVAYCAWRTKRDGVEYRLASEEEWEKAARGVDGRWFPWGWRFDARLCNMRESRKERPGPVAVEEFPRDVSVYGVRGLGGNVRDWTASEEVQGTGDTRRVDVVLRGGNAFGAARHTRAANRHTHVLAHVNDIIGFRLARSLPLRGSRVNEAPEKRAGGTRRRGVRCATAPASHARR